MHPVVLSGEAAMASIPHGVTLYYDPLSASTPRVMTALHEKQGCNSIDLLCTPQILSLIILEF